MRLAPLTDEVDRNPRVTKVLLGSADRASDCNQAHHRFEVEGEAVLQRFRCHEVTLEDNRSGVAVCQVVVPDRGDRDGRNVWHYWR